MTKVASTDKLRVDFLPSEKLKTKGRFGITAMPGRIGRGSTAIYDRDLQRDAAQLKAEERVNTLVSLMLREEYERNGPGVGESRNAFRRLGVAFEHFPFREGGAPAQEDAKRFVELIQNWLTRLNAGETIVIHSRAGHGRCGLVAACLLVAQGTKADEAIRIVMSTREHGIQGRKQEAYVHAFHELWYEETHLMHKLVRETLDESGISYDAELGEVDRVGFLIVTEGEPYFVTLLTNERAKSIASLVAPPMKVPENRRSAVAEYAARVNWISGFGSLEISFDEGILRAATSMTLSEGALTPAMVRGMLDAALRLMDRTNSSVRAVAFEGLEPAEAFSRTFS